MEIFEVASFVTATVTMCLMVVCSVWLVVLAFRQHIVWGFAVLLFPVTQIAFAILYWDRTRRPVKSEALPRPALRSDPENTPCGA